MKVLKFLLAAKYSQLSRMLVKYLIDCGHQVEVVEDEFRDKWLDLATHNIKVIANPNYPDYDFVIDFDHQVSTPIAKIDFNLNLINNQVLIEIGIIFENRYLILATGNANYVKSTKLQDQLESLYVEITEVFIDAIVVILRNGKESLVENNLVKDKKECNDLSEVLLLESQLSELNVYYVDTDLNDTKFKLNAKSKFGAAKYITLNFDNYDINQEQLEILALYLLTLFNSRNAALYSYELQANNNNIIKCIDLNPDLSYQQLHSLISHNRYDITQNSFYHGDTNLSTDILVSYNSAHSEKNYLLKLSYDPSTKLLEIKYNQELYFFSNMPNLITNYFNELPKWQQHEQSFDSILFHNPEYFSTQLQVWNDNSSNYPSTSTIQQVFNSYVENSPDKIAVSYLGVNYTYAQVNSKANQLANYLVKNYKIEQDDFIGLCLDKSELMIIALLAILKAGAAYVPMDHSYNKARISYMLSDSSPKAVLLNAKHEKLIDSIIEEFNVETTTLAIDTSEFANLLSEQPVFEPVVKATSNNLAYLIYTSGTTGKPKGVMVEHHNVVSLVNNSGYITINESDGFILLSDIAFDAATFEVWGALLNGAKLAVVEDTQEIVSDLPKLKQVLKNEKVTIMWLTKTLFDTLYLQDYDLFSSLNYLLIGGEALDFGLVAKLTNSAGCPKNIVNGYGPTENTTFSCTYLVKDLTDLQSIPIGVPLANRGAVILDSKLRLLPVGAIGELYLGGEGLARGYLNMEQITNERFISSPFEVNASKTSLGTRLYKTGDLVRYLADGNIEYIGRNDFQVKIRGYRIELPEIEVVLAGYPGIKQNLVVAKNHTDSNGNVISKYLVAYYVANQEIVQADLIKYLEVNLPDYMIPNSFTYMESFPLTSNGKINLRALPEPEFSTTDTYVKPRNEIETGLCQIWGQVLGIPQVGIYDDFFKLGGNSILAIKLIYETNRSLNKNLEIKTLYSARNVALLAQYLEKDEFVFKDYQIEVHDNHDNHDLYEPFTLSNVQQAYAIGRASNSTLGGVATHIYYEVVYNDLDTKRLENAINKLIDRHIILKSIFTTNLNQVILNQEIKYKLPEHVFKNKDELNAMRNKMAQEIIPFDQTPLFNIVASKLEYLDNKYLVHFSFDALLLDVASIRMFIQELDVFYSNPDSILPALTINFRDYRKQIDLINQSSLYTADRDYWANKLDDYNFELPLPLVCNPNDVAAPKFARVVKVIDNAIWQKIVDKSQKYGISLTAIILMIYGKTMAYWSGQEKVCINLTLFNRLPLHEQINAIMGDFTILELFNYYAQPESSIKEGLNNTHNELWSDIKHSLFDGIDFMRLIRQNNDLPINQVIAPVVLTSVLGEEFSWAPFLGNKNPLINYMTAQSPQVWIDNKAYEVTDGLMAEWDYLEQIFDQDTIKEMHADYCYLIERLADMDWETELLPNLKPSARDLEIVQKANSNIMPISSDTLFGAYQDNAIKYNYFNELAVFDDGKKVNYTHQQVIDTAKKMARFIVHKNQNINEPSKLIAILSEKGFNQVVSTLAIMEAGHAYLPLHVEWPYGRLLDILAEGKVQIVLVSRKQFYNPELRRTLGAKHQLLVIEEIMERLASDKELYEQMLALDMPKVTPEDIAYVIFTSGSTGKPKGVTIDHKGALNTINAVNERFDIGTKDCVFALSELSFDLSVYDIFGLLIAGGKISYPDQSKTKEPAYWIELINQNKATIWNTVPQLAELLINQAELDGIYIAKLRLFLLSGDWIPLNLPEKIKQEAAKAQVVSLGGATEGSIWSIWHEIDKVDSNLSSIPYGVAMPNQSIHILDNKRKLCPIGVNGEIYIGGTGVAVNYWGDALRTNASFSYHEDLGRIYKTGDLGRWHRDGFIEFMGRKDNQVKLNGYRVELEEISVKLTQLPGIDNAIVKIQEKNNRSFVVGYLVPEVLVTDTSLSDVKIADDERMKFRIAQHGLDNGREATYKLPMQLDENLFRLRKSYRNFSQIGLRQETINNITRATSAEYLGKTNKTAAKKDFSKEELANLFATIAGLELEDKATPKYRYPSGGSSYGVRTYLTTNVVIDDIRPGKYYFHPTKQSLVEQTDAIVSENDSMFKVEFVGFMPAIQELYGKFATKLAYIEMGHMLGLLISYLDSINMPYQIVINDPDDDTDNISLGYIKIGTINYQLPGSGIEFNLLTHDKVQHAYVDSKLSTVIQLSEESVFTRSGDFYQTHVMEKAGAMLSIDGEYSLGNLVASCILAQQITTKLYVENIGSCMLGITPYKDGLYAFVLGAIDENEKKLAETKVKQLTLKGIINNELSATLPDYMLPFDYIVINNLPLTANGKLDMKKLPLLHIDDSSHYIAPRNSLEEDLCTIWKKFLKVEELGISDNFIKSGGNSIMAIQLCSELHSIYKVEITITDLLAHPTIEELVEHINFENDTSEEDILWI